MTAAVPSLGDNRIGLGVLGLGLAGSVMAAAAIDHPHVELVAAADPNQDLARAFHEAEGRPAYRDLDGLLTAANLDAVYVGTPHQLHREHVLAAVAAGKHVIVEKPMALELADCDSMVAAADRAGVTLIVGHSHGFDPAVMRIGDAVRTGAYGPLAMVSMWNYTDFMYRPRRPEELDANRGGGIVFNQIPHQIDILRTVAGRDVVGVQARTWELDDQRRVPGAAMIMLELAGGASASLVYSGYDHFDSDELHGWIGEGGRPKPVGHGKARRALVGLDGDGERRLRARSYGYGASTITRPPHQPHFGELVVTCARADLRVGADEVLVYDDEGFGSLPLPSTPWWPGRGDVLAELVAAVRCGRKPFHDGLFGRETVRTVLAIAESAAITARGDQQGREREHP
jgi:phthalate 4,5-cis-dihydrodiol dehydrogenase